MGGVVMWIARDRNGRLCAYNHKPYKDNSDGVWRPDKMANSYLMLDTADFPEIKWADSEPTEVELVIKK